mmetsp:Transcript_36670/g.82925  ORF Transcript_36670/g.82925 Transcript_36670/m.82925 type:complete len:383 (+) Transcript_36670:127-1275(+)
MWLQSPSAADVHAKAPAQASRVAGAPLALVEGHSLHRCRWLRNLVQLGYNGDLLHHLSVLRRHDVVCRAASCTPWGGWPAAHVRVAVLALAVALAPFATTPGSEPGILLAHTSVVVIPVMLPPLLRADPWSALALHHALAGALHATAGALHASAPALALRVANDHAAATLAAQRAHGTPATALLAALREGHGHAAPTALHATSSTLHALSHRLSSILLNTLLDWRQGEHVGSALATTSTFVFALSLSPCLRVALAAALQCVGTPPQRQGPCAFARHASAAALCRSTPGCFAIATSAATTNRACSSASSSRALDVGSLDPQTTASPLASTATSALGALALGPRSCALRNPVSRDHISQRHLQPVLQRSHAGWTLKSPCRLPAG